MRKALLVTSIAVPFAFLLLAAHFVRSSQTGLAVVFLLAPFLLVVKSRRLLVIVQMLLGAGCIVWLHACGTIVASRVLTGDSWARAAVILIAVTLFTALCALFLQHKNIKHRYPAHGGAMGAGAIAFLLVALIGAFPYVKIDDPIPLLAERFIKGAGWVELFALALYGSWLTGKLTNAKSTARIRRNVWVAFSCVFFAQVILGLAGIDKMLMTGTLHLPVPAMIIAAPLYRGEWSHFMPILLGITMFLAGPAWCSWFCYLGSADLLASQVTSAPEAPLKNPFVPRLIVLAGVIATPVIMRVSGVPLAGAIAAGALFGAAGIAVMLISSRKRGIMIHCTAYCPIGLITTTAGKLNPFRIRIGSKCTRCHACIRSCRYGALSPEAIIRHTPSLTCTLCGDCIAACESSQLQYHFPFLTSVQAKNVFLVIVVVIHTLFMGFGRL